LSVQLLSAGLRISPAARLQLLQFLLIELTRQLVGKRPIHWLGARGHGAHVDGRQRGNGADSCNGSTHHIQTSPDEGVLERSLEMNDERGLFIPVLAEPID
jgi:hypothetical protein